MKLEHITGQNIAGAIKVHTALGPGLLENADKLGLAHELRSRGMHVEIEKPIPISYNGIGIDVGYRADMLIEDQIVVETKAVSNLLPVFRAQLVSQSEWGVSSGSADQLPGREIEGRPYQSCYLTHSSSPRPPGPGLFGAFNSRGVQSKRDPRNSVSNPRRSPRPH